MKVGDVFFCGNCGLELTVSKDCNCADENACSEAGFICCGEEMQKK